MQLIRVLLIILFSAAILPAETIRVGAAISLKESITNVAANFEKETGDKVEFVFGASGQIATQVQNGADLDVFISAADKQIDDLAKADLIVQSTRHVIAGNALVLIVPTDVPNAPTSFDALRDESVKKVAIGEPKTVPAGQYAQQTLSNLKLADVLTGKLVFGTNVRQVLSYVERGEVSAGIVYATDAKQSGDKIKVVATADEKTHDAIVYPAVVIKTSPKAKTAKRFIDYCGTDVARMLLEEKGFTTPKKSSTTKPTE